VGKVNVHENFELANEYDIQSIPRILLFRGSKKPIRQMAGLVSEAQLARMLNEVL
jgi:thioredoxin-like negative regulator of GroEL